ncbi:MAG: hypothetical protein JW913_10635 [Chitinispirillaceae bacterium]|nr:hypothetical protein [Chitinispirillaceae bacterium]
MENISMTPDSTSRNDRTAIIRSTHRGEFWKACPGTTGGYLCCGYQIITPMIGCGMYCSYCILQVYFENESRVVFENFDDLRREINEKLSRWPGIVRFGTGEFTDSLHAEERTGLSVAVADLLEAWPQVIVEFKTKSAVVAPLAKIRRPGKVIIGYSLNTPRMIALMERNTASLEERFKAARQCLEMGFNVAFHFDPIFYYDGWEEEYRQVVDMIYETVTDVKKIAWCSLGGFRSNPALKTRLKERQQHLPLFSGEMIIGADGKLRYFRPIRSAIYRAMQEAFFRHQPEAPIYYCMESPEIWEETGMIGRIQNGLPAYLDDRARALLSVEAGRG